MTPPQNRTPDAARHDPRAFAVVLQGVSRFFKSYQVRALSDVTFAVRRGEVFGVLGPSGSGKSTALRLIAGRLRPTEGSVRVFERRPQRSSVRVRIGYLPPVGETATAGWAGFFRRFFGVKRPGSDKSVVVPGKDIDRRAQLKQALARNPDLLVLDEPFAGLDPVHVGEVQELIRSLARDGRTIIVSGRSLAEVGDICNRLAVLAEGRVQAVGTIDQWLTDPGSIRFLAPLLPESISRRVLNLIRDEMSASTPPGTPEKTGPASSGIVDRTPQAGPAGTTTVTAAILSSLLSPNTDAPPALTPSEPQSIASDPVNHQKLAGLTKSPSTIPPASKGA